MTHTAPSASALPHTRRLRDVAIAGAVQQPAALASMCAFALLGAPATGVVVASLIAWSRSRTALERSLHRLRGFEDELAKLRRDDAARHARAEHLRVEVQRRSSAAARERAQVAERAQRLVCDPAQAIVEMLNETDAQAARRLAPQGGAPFTQIIHAALATLAQTVRDGFDPSPPDTRAIVLDETPLDLRDVIDAAVVLLAPRAIAKGLRLRVCIDRSLAASVLADRDRVGQIVFNLLGAAIASADAGQLTIAARTETLNAGSQRVFIGISGALRAEPADPRRVPGDEGAVPVPAGLVGLDDPDLALCRVLAQRMGGDIEVGNSAAFGVCVAFHAPLTVERFARLPSDGSRRRAVVELSARDERLALCDLLDKLGVVVVPEGMPEPADVDLWFVDEQAPPPDAARASRVVSLTESFIPGGLRDANGALTLSVNPLLWSAVQRVCALRGSQHRMRARRPRTPDTRTAAPAEATRTALVVDDNEINRKVVARQLDVLGYRCVTAVDAEAALAEMTRQCFDLLITDLHMPGASGIELAARVRAMNRGLSSTMPVVLITGETDAGKRADVPPGLFAAVLPKPTSLDALAACLRALFSGPLPGAAPAEPPPVEPPPVEPPHEEPLDRQHLDALAGQGVDVREVLNGWQQAMQDDLACLRTCRERGEREEQRALLHRLSGAVGLVGAAGLMDALREASVTQPEPPAALLDSLVARMRALIAQLRRDDVER
ncbi:response regulator [Paraburkholderia solisilvae]|uniref:histidine kinase n=1 Tax=Paraburkholderia solisilvae TaxID=624376 RepID=A0A6J5F112_9BURK|nr:response regulator [Paraburkholderia solisilvae]CAB3772044.1 Sensor histidine kinase RcsC [Paraburkholderia solisilvae]